MSRPLNRAEQALARLTGRQRLAVQALCALGQPTLSEIADEMGDDEIRNTRRAVTALRDLGIAEVASQGGTGGRMTFRLTAAIKLQACAV